MPKYNGHRSWNAWNVSLWINNDFVLYKKALWYVRNYTNKDIAAREFLKELPDKTPDGANYNYTCVREALDWLE